STAGQGAGADAAGAGADEPAGATGVPRAYAYSGVMLTADNSLRIGDGKVYDNREEDIRFDCREAGCELESDSAVFTQVYGDPGDGTYDTCSMLTASQTSHRHYLAASAAGSEICFRDGDGNVGLLVVQVKSTAVPKLGFLTADLTVWKD
ncbi:serine/threonine protein kinase, partial [Actinospica acidiphila]